MLDKVRQAFPKARFENATEFLQEARSVKGAEEVAWIERAAEILDRVVAAIISKAKPGVMENDMVATIWQTIIANGGDYPSMTHWAREPACPGPRIARTARSKPAIWLTPRAKYGGYIAQTVGRILGKIPDELSGPLST